MEYDTLVLAGGGSKGILTLGALQYCYDNDILKNVQTYFGTSIGAIISYLLIIGYSPIEIIVYICSNQSFEKLNEFNILSLLRGNGACSFNIINEVLEKMTIDKVGFFPTLEDLKNKFNKKLFVTTYNITENKTEYLSYENYPNLPSLIALRMTSNVPLVFEKYKYGNSFYIDGGISNNFPIDIAEKYGKHIFGIYFLSQNNISSDPNQNLLEYIYQLMFIPMKQANDYKIQYSVNNPKYKICSLDCSDLKFLNFDINSKDKLELFSSGYQQFRKIFE
jgi:NTE family protein